MLRADRYAGKYTSNPPVACDLWAYVEQTFAIRHLRCFMGLLSEQIGCGLQVFMSTEALTSTGWAAVLDARTAGKYTSNVARGLRSIFNQAPDSLVG